MRGAPTHIRCDNGPEMTAHALIDWCQTQSTQTSYIDPGAPWQNPFVESFHSRVRDELLNLELFSCLAEASVLIEDWRQDYNANRPHSALGRQAPAVFAAASTPAADRRPADDARADRSTPLGSPSGSPSQRAFVRGHSYAVGATSTQLSQ